MKGFWGALFGLIMWVAVTPFAILGFVLLKIERLIKIIKEDQANDR